MPMPNKHAPEVYRLESHGYDAAAGFNPWSVTVDGRLWLDRQLYLAARKSVLDVIHDVDVYQEASLEGHVWYTSTGRQVKAVS